MRSKPEHYRGEVGVGGQENELIEVSRMFKGVEDIENHVYIRAVFSARGQRRAVDNTARGAREEGPEPPVHDRIEVTGPDEDLTPRVFRDILYNLPHIFLYPP